MRNFILQVGKDFIFMGKQHRVVLEGEEMNKAFVDIIVRNYNRPIGVATYKTKQDMPEELQKALPDLDRICHHCCYKSLDGDTAVSILLYTAKTAIKC